MSLIQVRLATTKDSRAVAIVVLWYFAVSAVAWTGHSGIHLSLALRIFNAEVGTQFSVWNGPLP